MLHVMGTGEGRVGPTVKGGYLILASPMGWVGGWEYTDAVTAVSVVWCAG